MTEQNLDFLNHTTSENQQSCLQEKSVMQNLRNMCNQHALVMCMCFIQHTPDKSLRVINFADFLDMRVKNLDFVQSLVAFGISNIKDSGHNYT